QVSHRHSYKNVAEFIDFSQKLTRQGESGVYGFNEHLDRQDAAQLLLQSVTTEARLQTIFRQFEGLLPMPILLEPYITQSMARTLLAPFVKSYPPKNPKL
ncbi:hypothetical protein HOY80DRAFT_873271, partial [Tuber brumale]